MFKPKFVAILIVSNWILLGDTSFASETEHKNSPCVVDAFLRAHERTMQAGSNEDAVDRVISLVSEDLIYEHPKFGIKIETAEQYRQGLVAFLGATDKGRYEVIEYMVNDDAVAISMNRKFNVQSDGQWQQQSVSQMTVFEVREGKISRIIDYW